MSENRRRGAREAGRRALLKGLFGAALLPPMDQVGDQALFLSVQHPGERFGTRTDPSAAPRGSNWPHGKTGAPPQPAVVAIRRKT